MSAEPRVFITQIPSKRDPATHKWMPTVNIAPAQRFGKVVVMLPPNAQWGASTEIVRLLKARLAEEGFTPDDYLLPMGSPAVMAAASAIVARRGNGAVRLLEWDRTTSAYNEVKLENLV